MSYAIVNLDNMSGTKQPADLVSAKYYVNTTATAVENGNVVKLDSRITGEREVWKAVTPDANSALRDCVLVASVELMFDERKKNLDEFRNEAGEIIRGYRFKSGGTFSVTAEALTASSPAIGNVVELQADTKFKVVSSLTDDSTKVGTIIDIFTQSGKTFYCVEIV